MTSRPLFISVAESTVIRAPIVPRRVAQRSARPRRRRARRASCRGTVRRDAVRTSDSTESADSPRKQLVQRGVLGVDRDQRRAAPARRVEHERAAGDEALLVRERDVDAGLERGERRVQPGDADARVQHEVGRDLGCEPGDAIRALEHASCEPRARTGRGLAIGEGDRVHAMQPGELAELAIAAAGGQGDNLNVREGLDDIEGLTADRARRAEQGEALHEKSG